MILERTEAGLSAEGGGFSAGEAVWVTTRLAELLGWRWHNLLQAGDVGN